MAKLYDRAYFDRWYRSARRVVTPAGTRRKARLALAAAEYLLERPVRSVLDIGCGEGAWRGTLRRMRPDLRWVGIDPSAYVVRRYGRRRGIRAGEFGDLPRLKLRGPFDLIVCSDVLHYVPTRELQAGLPALVRLLRGVAWIEVFTCDDALDGDREGFHLRSEARYRELLQDAGLANVGLNCWAARDWLDNGRVGRMERSN